MISELAIAGRMEHQAQFLDNQHQSNKYKMTTIRKKYIIFTNNQYRNIWNLRIPDEACWPHHLNVLYLEYRNTEIYSQDTQGASFLELPPFYLN